MSTTIERIPLFPLNTVLFPGMQLSLHVFEERYQRMLHDCSENNGAQRSSLIEATFGVALIREGREVGQQPARPHDIGTIARIAEAVPLGNGRYLLQTHGVRRFRVVRLLYDKPYLQGEVEMLSESRDAEIRACEERRPSDPALVARAIASYHRYVEALRAVGGEVADAPSTAPDSNSFSWMVASSLIVAPPLRQELLEMSSVERRLRRELELLDLATDALHNHARTPRRHMPFSLN